jgi:hypothetical protein
MSSTSRPNNASQEFLLNALTSGDPNHWDLGDACLSDKDLRILAQATESDVDWVMAWLRAKVMKGILEAREGA